jgi:hypothetical protein
MLEQPGIRHGLRPVIDDDVGWPFGIGGETRQHGPKLVCGRRLSVDADGEPAVDVEVKRLCLPGAHGRPLSGCQSDGDAGVSGNAILVVKLLPMGRPAA